MHKGRQILGKLFWAAVFLAQLTFSASAQRIMIDSFVVEGTNWTHYAPHARVALEGFPGGTNYYTLDGSVPNRGSLRYTNSIVLSNSLFLRFVTYSSGTLVRSRDVKFDFVKIQTLRVTMDGGFSPLGFVEVSTNGAPFSPISNGTMIFQSGQEVALRAVDGNGWKFDRWKGPHGTTARMNVVKMTNTFEVRLSMFTTNELAIPTPEGNGRVMVDRSPPYYMADPEVQVTAVPDEGYYFSGWDQPAASVGAISYAQRLNEPFKTATFFPLPEGNFALNARVEGRGAITANNNRFVGPPGDTALLAFAPSSGWKPAGWSGNVLAGAPTVTNTILVRLDTNNVAVARATNFTAFWPERNLFAAVSAHELLPLSFRSPAVADDGTVAIGAVAGNHMFVEGFDREGYNIWEIRSTAWPGEVATAQPSIGPNNVVYVPEPTSDPAVRGWITGYSMEGKMLFEISHSGSPVPSLAINENGLYVAVPFRRLQRFSLDGALLAETPLQPDQDAVMYTLAPNGDIFLGQFNFYHYNRKLELLETGNAGVNAAAGRSMYRALDGVFYLNPMEVTTRSNYTRLWVNNTDTRQLKSIGVSQLYGVNFNQRLSALRNTDSLKQWSLVDPYANNVPRQVVALADGNVIATFSNNTIRKISSLGAIMWEAAGVNDAGAEPVLTDKGILYVGAAAYDIGVGPALSGYAMLHGDWRRSGAPYTGSLAVVNKLSVAGEGSARRLLFMPGTLKTLILESTDQLDGPWTMVKTFVGTLEYPLNATGGPRYFRVVFP